MAEFWEEAFKDKQEMWGFEPSKSTILTNNFFLKNGMKNVLVPGVGYGRNARIFAESGMDVTGIEISQTAIDLAKKHYKTDIKIYRGSVTDMPFDNQKYDGIYCYALIHLLDTEERINLIRNCYHQLSENGYMVFVAITKTAPNFGKGKLISKDRYEFHKGAKIFYYNKESVKTEFGNFGLYEITEVDENQPMFLIKCKKNK